MEKKKQLSFTGILYVQMIRNTKGLENFQDAWISKKGFLLFPKYLKDLYLTLLGRKVTMIKVLKIEDIMDVNETCCKKII